MGIEDPFWGASVFAQDRNGQTVEASHGVTRGVDTGEERWFRGAGDAQEVERRIERAGFRPKSWSYGWDAFDRLVACETPQGERWRYAYDPFGRRVEKRRHGVRACRSAFTWDGDVPIEETPLREGGTPDYDARTDWHYEPGSFAPLAKVAAERLSYVVTDHLGTPRELLSEKGEVEWAASY